MRQLGLMFLMLAALLFNPVYAQDEEGEGEAKVQTTYFDIKPAFVVNYGGPGRLRYIKTSITLRVAAGEMGMKGVRHHLPRIRDVIVATLTKQSEEDVSSMEGKELIRQSLLEGVQAILAEEEGEQHVVDLLFSSFIVQR